MSRSNRVSMIGATLCVLAMPLQFPCAVAGDDDPARWLTYKELRGSLRAGGAESQGEMGLLTNISSNVEVQGSFVLKRAGIDAHSGKVEFRGPLVGKVAYRSAMEGVSAEDFNSDLASVCSSAIGVDGEVILIVDYKDGKYTLSAHAPGSCAANRVRIEAQGQSTEAEMGDVLANVMLPFEVLLGGGLPLPQSGKSITTSVPVLLQAGLTPPVQGVGQWWIETDPVATEVSVEPEEGYKTWTPEGYLAHPDQPGKWLKIKVKAYRKDDPGTLVPATLRFTLQRVSREPGVCLNWPIQDADQSPDLRLEFQNPDLGAPSGDGTSIRTNRPVKELELIVNAYDFGAWGTLQVSGTDVNGLAVAVKVSGQQGSELYIPLDEDQNHIADAWEPEYAKGRRSDADDEHQEGNSHDGDGLTLYEEYRGFVEANERVQGSPSKKDFFVVNLIGAPARNGLKLFKEATELEVHSDFTPEEIDVFSRVVNRYSSSGVEQHGVVLSRYPDGADPDFSMAEGGPGTPAKVSRVLITSKQLKQPQPLPGTSYSDADWEVAHELAHAASVRHHGEDDPEDLIYKPRDGRTAFEYREGQPRIDVQLLREDGTIVGFGRQSEMKIWLGREGGQHSGVEQCLMRYQKELAAYEAPASFGDGTVPVRYLVADQPAGIKLCRNRPANDFNSPQHTVTTYNKQELNLPRWGKATPGRGNCWSQINVNDRMP